MSRLAVWGAAALMALGGAAAAQDGEGCLAPGQIKDQDVARHAAHLGQGSGLCVSEIPISENGLNWRFTIVENTKQNRGPTIFLLHDNENSAFDTAIYAVRKYGGKVVAVEAGDRRNFNGQDPNRNFGLTQAATAPCRDMKRKPAPVFTTLLTDLQAGRPSFFLTLHNNANGHSSNGGSGGISAARDSAVMNGEMAPGGGDEDDAVLLAGTTPLEQNASARKLIDKLHKARVNVIYEHVTPQGNDCSFSNYVVLNRLGDYYNIEAQHGHTSVQKHMLDVLMSLLRVKVRDKSVQ